MENNIDMIITLDNNDKYMILDQGNYNEKAYYLLSKLDENDNLTSTVAIACNDNGNIVSVKDEKLLEALIKYFDSRKDK